jgi:uncharacterized membrane protein YgcG
LDLTLSPEPNDRNVVIRALVYIGKRDTILPARWPGQPGELLAEERDGFVKQWFERRLAYYYFLLLCGIINFPFTFVAPNPKNRGTEGAAPDSGRIPQSLSACLGNFASASLSFTDDSRAPHCLSQNVQHLIVECYKGEDNARRSLGEWVRTITLGELTRVTTSRYSHTDFTVGIGAVLRRTKTAKAVLLALYSASGDRVDGSGAGGAGGAGAGAASTRAAAGGARSGGGGARA